MPASAKSKYPTWLIARIAPPSFGIFSTPAKSKRNFKYFQKDLINTTTEYENKISLDGGISTSLYGIEETVGGQSTTLFQQGDKIFDSSSSRLLASVSSAGQLNDGDSYEALLEFKIRNISTTSYVVGETVIGGTSTVSAEVVSFNRTSSILTLKSPIEYSGNHLFSVGESLVGNSSGATSTLVQRAYPVYARNEEE